MVYVKLFALLAACLLAGCGGPQQENQDVPELPTPAASKPPDPVLVKRPVIVAFGDSLTAGLGVDEGKSYPAYLQRLLDNAGYRYRVENAGISGDTTGGGLDRVDSVLAMNPEIVVVALGANDGLRGLPLASTRANLDEIITALKRGGAKVVVAGMTLPRNYGPDYIRSFERIFADLAERHDVPLIPFLLAGVAEDWKYMQDDRLHPTAEGNQRIAATVMKTIQPLLKGGS
jgi:acyl-CoA thioesterase-1